MKGIYERYLLSKGYLIGKEPSSDAFAYTFAMANLFGVRIVRGKALASEVHLEILSRELGQNVPPSFYRGFPESVRKLTREQLLFDQLLHYVKTYGFGDFDTPDYSRFEEDFQRAAFQEDVEMRDFVILSEKEAEEQLHTLVCDLLSSTRPLSDAQYGLVLAYAKDNGKAPAAVASKNTAIRLYTDTGILGFADSLWLSDVIKVCAEIHYRRYGNEDLCDLHLRGSDRRFLTALIHKIISDKKINLAQCYEKKKLFQGLLHHLHFKPENEDELEFLRAMRSRGNGSVYAVVERALKRGDVPFAVTALYEAKGGGAVVRELNYFISRAEDKNDVRFILSHIDASPILLVQLYLQYATYRAEGGRTFRFTRFGRLRTHTEDEDEVARRRSRLTPEMVDFLCQWCKDELRRTLRGKVGKVYIDKEMYKIALPLSEASTEGGLFVLPRGSRLPLPEGKKIRAFTYWEAVNDIDLSVIGIFDDGTIDEFSWRTMWDKQNTGIVYSGDQTAGFHGGSEYFDIEFKRFKNKHPGVSYLVFTDNVYSSMTFDKCICRAGYMMRDKIDSGEVFEPKTVESSFTINANTTSAYLFGIDLIQNEFVWLNVANHSGFHVAAQGEFAFLLDYFHMCEHMNVGMFFEWMAESLTCDPMEADIVLSTKDVGHKEGAEVIRRYDFEKILKYLQ